MKKIIYSPGEPSGIGPDLIIQLSCSTFWNQINIPIACIADPELLIDRANTLGKKIKIKEISNPVELKKNKRNEIQVIKIAKCPNTKYGKLHRSNAKYVLDNLNYGIDTALTNKKVGLVTGPISKENIISIDKKFSGHTEHIQKLTKSKDVLMLLESEKLKVALATTHIPLKAVPKKITKSLIINLSLIHI